MKRITTRYSHDLPRIREEMELKSKIKIKIENEEMYGPSDAVFKQRKADSRTES